MGKARSEASATPLVNRENNGALKGGNISSGVRVAYLSGLDLAPSGLETDLKSDPGASSRQVGTCPWLPYAAPSALVAHQVRL